MHDRECASHWRPLPASAFDGKHHACVYLHDARESGDTDATRCGSSMRFIEYGEMQLFCYSLLTRAGSKGWRSAGWIESGFTTNNGRVL